MKHYYHYIYYLIIGLLFIMLWSCQKDDSKNKKYVIGFSQCTSDSWREAVLLEMQIEISNYKNVDLIVYNAMDNNSRQIAQIRKLISQNVDVLIISPNEAIPITDVAVEAYRKGIPTIIHDRKIQSEEYTVSIGADNYSIGNVIGEYVSSILPEKSTILEIWGLEGSSPAIERHEGFINSLDKDKNIKIKQVFGKWHYNIALQEIANIGHYRDIDLVYAHNDAMALAARDVIMEKDSIAGKHIKFIGIDGVFGDGEGLEAIANEKLEASFQYPTGGALAIQVAMSIINKENVKKNYSLNTTIIDKTNAKTILAQSKQVNSYQQRINKQKEEEHTLLTRFQFLKNSTILILVLLMLIVSLLGYVLYTNLRIKSKNKELQDKNLLVETQKEELSIKNKQIESVSDQKLQFFTNISHEIRTPITLIVGPINKLARNSNIDISAHEDILVIKKNIDRLYRIVNQILDFRRIDNNKMKLVLKEVDLISQTKEIFGYFVGIADEKQIDYKFTSNVEMLMISIDVNKIEQVLVNIISNAFKYSKKNGEIKVSINSADDLVTIDIEDTGRGLSKEDKEHLFERFYTNSKNFGVSGFGIGLNLSKEYIDLHNGAITVESQPGEHTVFSITLSKDINNYNSEYIVHEAYTENINNSINKMDINLVPQKLSQKYHYRILIVEDDPDIRSYLRKEMNENFEIITAENGLEALDILSKSNDISLIISDIIMPEMNGFQLCNKIKRNIVTSHIPVILLTALSEDSQRIYGIAEGADEYIQKPFDIIFLKIRAINIIEERVRMKSYFIERLRAGAIDNSEINKIINIDDLFRYKLLDVLEKSYENSDFSIEELSEKLAMSRVHLYRKIKDLFGLSPTDFLRNYRLNKALILIELKQLPVNEIAYLTGFTSPAYFTKCFKTLYGITPTECSLTLRNK